MCRSAQQSTDIMFVDIIHCLLLSKTPSYLCFKTQCFGYWILSPKCSVLKYKQDGILDKRSGDRD
jgi:hypothetical protein